MAAATMADTHGALLLTSYISVIMYGTVLFQVYLYLTRYPQDPKFIKSLVGCVFVTDTVQTAFTVAASYWWLITNFANPPALLVGYWSFDALFHIDPILALLAQGFFTRRVWIVSHKNKPLCAILSTAVFVRFGLFNAMGAEVWIKQTFAGVSEILWLMIFALVFSMTTDLAITASLTYYLHKGRTGFNKTDSLINQLIIYSMTTALLPCLFDVVVVICIGTMPNNLIWPGMHLILTKTYPNTLLATLNTRENKRGGSSQELRSLGATSTVTPGLSNSFGGVNSHSGFKNSHPMQRGVLVTQEQHTEPWVTNSVVDLSTLQKSGGSDVEYL